MVSGEATEITRAIERRLIALSSVVAATPAQREAAAASRRFLLEQLNSGQMGKRLVNDFMIGSYARHTALTPLDDIDLVFIIDPRFWQTKLQGLVGKRPSSKKVLGTFATALRRRYRKTSVRLQRRSVGLLLSKAKIDLVPAIPDPSRTNWLYIPDRKKDSWIESAPQIHTDVATAVNKANGGRFKPLVRILKAWNNRIPKNARLKSFAIETIATRLFSRVSMVSLLDGLDLFFDFLCSRTGQKATRSWKDDHGVSLSWWSCEVLDMAGSGSNLVHDVDAKRVRAFVRAVLRTRTAIAKARRARSAETAWRFLERRF